MSESDHQAGLSGKPFQPDMDLADYERGAALRLGPKVEVPGVAFTLILVSPFLPMVYPVLGLTIYAAVAGVVALSFALPTPKKVELFPGIVLSVAAFSPGCILERRISELGIYRILRSTWRLTGLVILSMLDLIDGSLSFIGPGLLARASGVELFSLLIFLFVVHLVCTFVDRLYFPVKAEVLRQREHLAKGQALTRGRGKRWLYGALWLLPVLVACSIAGNTAITRFVPEQLETLRPVVYLAGLTVWFLLCVFGILPGTSKRKKVLFDPNAIEV